LGLVREGAKPAMDLTSAKADGVMCLHHVSKLFCTSYA
jgi:hypothetical protein